MNILIVSGFLGAGKTTFIRALVAHTGKEIAILENEYGEAGIDGEILRGDSSAGELNIWEMTEGCICCSMKGELSLKVLTIANAVDPEYLVIESTGVGYLSRILSNLREIEYERIRLLQPVTIVDGHSVDRYLREYRQLYTDQIVHAGVILVSKLEQADREEQSLVRDKIAALHPGAQIITEHYSGMSREQWLALLGTRLDGTPVHGTPVPGGTSLSMEVSMRTACGSASGSRVSAGKRSSSSQEVSAAEEEQLPDTFSLSDIEMDGPEELVQLLERLIHGAYGNIFRAKGVVSCGPFACRFDVADGRYGITGADSTGEESVKRQVVFIGTGIRRQPLRRCLYEKKRTADGSIRLRTPYINADHERADS